MQSTAVATMKRMTRRCLGAVIRYARGAGEWPLSESNTLRESPEMSTIRLRGGAESGALGDDSGFADAVAAVMRLPLSDTEKAEAVRRMLAGRGR